MTLYSADLSDLAKPVPKKGKKQKVLEDETPQPKKQPRKRKRDIEASQVYEAAEEEKEVQAKKLAKKEAAAAKRAAKKAAVTPPPPPQTAVSEVSEEEEEEEPPKKEDLVIPTEAPKLHVPEKKAKKIKVEEEDGEPPKWFLAYMQGVKSEEAKQSKVKKPKKVVAAESKKAAGVAWSQGVVRDRVNHEVDNHMNRMYTQIFGGRRM